MYLSSARCLTSKACFECAPLDITVFLYVLFIDFINRLLLASGSDDNYILIHRLAINAGAHTYCN